jgi:hypothetical protein
MTTRKADSLRVGALLFTPRDYCWSEHEFETEWEVIQPYGQDDFEEISGDAYEYSDKCEEKLGYGSYDSMEESNQPMMDYYYPLPSEYDYDAQKLKYVNLCLVRFPKDEVYGLALTGGGMDFSWDICRAYILLGFYPPIHFRLPQLAGMSRSKKNLDVVKACIKGRRIVKMWADSDIKDLKHVRDGLVS